MGKRKSAPSEWDVFYEKMDELIQGTGWYSGVPVEVDGMTIVGNTHVASLSAVIDENQKIDEEDNDDDGTFTDEDGCWFVRNSWKLSRPWKNYFCGQVGVVENLDTGRTKALVLQDPRSADTDRRFKFLVETGAARMCSATIKAETVARKRLEEMLSDAQWKCYFLTDTFIERGRSGIAYILRKNRPTIAFRNTISEEVRTLCVLCLHPLAYYKDTWAGAMCPSDEVIAHLLHIRADEHYFWRKANHISLDSPNSGM